VHDGNDMTSRHRELFVAFLERLANSNVDWEQWQHLVVNHYVDTTLERIRQDCVRICMGNERMQWSIEERDRIRAWIRLLRNTTA